MKPLFPSQSQSQSQLENRVDDILSVIWDIPEGEDASNWEVEDRLLDTTCHKVSKLSQDEFEDFQEKVLQCFINTEDWDSCAESFKVLEFLTGVLVFVCGIAEQKFVLEYLNYFSKAIMPPQVRLIVFPAILSAYVNRFSSDCDRICSESNANFILCLQVHLCHLKSSQDDAKTLQERTSEFVAFLKNALQYYLEASENFHVKILSGFTAAYQHISSACENDELRMTMFKSLARCLRERPTVPTLLIASVFVSSLRNIRFRSKTWTVMHIFLDKLHAATSHHRHQPEVVSFVAETISDFLQRVDVPNESCITSMKDNIKLKVAKLSGVTNSTGSSSESPVNSQDSAFSDSPSCAANNNNISNVTTNTNDSCNSGTAKANNSDKMLELLEKLLGKMKSSNVRLDSTAEKERLQNLIRELQSFL